MKQTDFFIELKSLGLPVAYSHFNDLKPPPYITYQFAYDADMKADNQNYFALGNYQVELYTAKKDLATERLLENKLGDLELPYTKTEFWIDDEKLFQIVYEIQLTGG